MLSRFAASAAFSLAAAFTVVPAAVANDNARNNAAPAASEDKRYTLIDTEKGLRTLTACTKDKHFFILEYMPAAHKGAIDRYRAEHPDSDVPVDDFDQLFANAMSRVMATINSTDFKMKPDETVAKINGAMNDFLAAFEKLHGIEMWTASPARSSWAVSESPDPACTGNVSYNVPRMTI